MVQMGRFLAGSSFWLWLLVAIQVVAHDGTAAAELYEADSLSAPIAQQSADPRLYSKHNFLPSDFFLEMDLDVGVRFDRLRWSIAGYGLSPNILSELAWSDVFSHQLTLGGRTRISPHFYGRGHVSFAWIQSGNVQDSDYLGDNRTQEFSRSVCETNGDHLWDVVAGVGYPFSFSNRRLFIAPMAGFSIHRQIFRITDGQQIISEPPSQTRIGPLDSRLNSLFSTMWQNVWIGCDLRYNTASSFKLPPPMAWELSLKYYVFADYSAEADWNLRSDLAHPVSFEHEARGQGISVQFLWMIYLSRHIDMNFTINYIRLKADDGTDKVYAADGRQITTRLNEVLWQSNSVMVGIAYRF